MERDLIPTKKSFRKEIYYVNLEKFYSPKKKKKQKLKTLYKYAAGILK